MIIGYFGFNGSGKTLSMCKALTGYDTVFCNFGFKGSAGQKVCQRMNCDELITVLEQYTDLMKATTGQLTGGERIALGIDEAGLNFPARSWKNISKQEAFLFAQSRKLGIDFLYTSQNQKMVDSILRNNTAMCAYPRHFFWLFWESWYEGTEKDRDMFMYRSMWNGRRYYGYYDTLEIVDSTKFYAEGDTAGRIDKWETVFKTGGKHE